MPADRWQDADAYERFIGRWSRRAADQFLAWLSVPAGATWVDVGCGTGALAGQIVARTGSRAGHGRRSVSRVRRGGARPGHRARRRRSRSGRPTGCRSTPDRRTSSCRGSSSTSCPTCPPRSTRPRASPAWRDRRRLRLGLRGADGAAAPVLGRGGRARPVGRGARRGSALSDRRARAAGDGVGRRRARRGPHRAARRPDPVRGLRRPVAAVHGRPSGRRPATSPPCRPTGATRSASGCGPRCPPGPRAPST